MAQNTSYICKIFEVDAIPTNQAQDSVILEFDGSLKRTTKRRIAEALAQEDFEIRENKKVIA